MIFASGPSRLQLYTKIRHYLAVFQAILTGAWKKGDDVRVLEETLARRLDVPHAVMMPLARTGIHLTIKHSIKPGQKVILSPYTIADVVNMVVAAGGIPVFADIDREICNMTPATTEAALKRIPAEERGAVLATHFYGAACDVQGISDVCARYDVPLIEDAAQALGLKIRGAYSGTVGNCGIFSFGLFKNVTAFYGGMVVTKDAAIADKIRQERDSWPSLPLVFFLKKVINGAITDFITWPVFFKIVTFRLFRYGLLNDVDWINNQTKIDVNPVLSEIMPAEYCHQPSPLQARLVLGQLDQVDFLTSLRQDKAARYEAGLQGLDALVRPPKLSDHDQIFWYYTIQYDDREALVKYAMRHGRDISMSYHRNCAALPCFAGFGEHNPDGCPNADKTANSLIYLPAYPSYPDSEIDANIAVINRFFAEQGAQDSGRQAA